jgi:L-asparagine transporter-like permease
MISIGGIIGAGLFVSSSTSIIAAGPASFISYTICGLLILLVMRMLGEMTTALPHVRSFTEFARAGLGEGAGFVVGWLYWYFWVLVVPVEAIAGAKILHTWIPAFSPLQTVLTVLVLTALTPSISCRRAPMPSSSSGFASIRSLPSWYSLPSRRRTPWLDLTARLDLRQSCRSWRIHAE